MKTRCLAAVLPAVLLAAPAVRAEEDVPWLKNDVPVESHLAPQHYAWATSGVLLVGGLGLGYWAQGEATRARGLSSARHSAAALRSAEASAATANALYALAGLSLAYGLVLHFLPPFEF